MNTLLELIVFLSFPFKYFLKVMVSRVVGTYFPRILVMAMHLLGLVIRCWKMRAADHHFRVEMEGMVGTAGITEGLTARGNVKVILGKPAVGLQTHRAGQMM